jgi:hypothetical protein
MMTNAADFFITVSAGFSRHPGRILVVVASMASPRASRVGSVDGIDRAVMLLMSFDGNRAIETLRARVAAPRSRFTEMLRKLARAANRTRAYYIDA